MFIKEGSSFPPEEWRFWFNRWNEYFAWYSGDPNQLLKYYSTTVDEIYSQFELEKRLFWSRTEMEERNGVVHLPAAGDIASMSSDLLFAESPIIRYNEESAGGKRFRAIIEENNIESLLLEGAEIAAAISGCFLKIDADPEILKLPIVSIINPLQAFPIFWRGRLWEILFFRVVKENTNTDEVWRLFENRKIVNGSLNIEYELYKGKNNRIGRIVDLESIDETAYLNLKNSVINGFNHLGVVYIPNKRPNNLILGSPFGINDYGRCISLMDSLDFAWTSWMRDIELGLGQILVDEELLQRDLTTSDDTYEKMKFSKFRKAFLKINMSSWKLGGDSTKPIEPIQFDLRVAEHKQTCEQLFMEIVSRSGYSPQSFGISIEGRAESGTALRIRERKSLLTRQKKSRYWQHGIEYLFMQLQEFDVRSGLSTAYQPEEIAIELQDSILTDEKELSETLRNIDQASCASTFTKVKMLHPEWEDTEIDEEVQKIIDEKGTVLPPFEGVV